MTAIIKFSHQYPKLWKQKKAKLVHIQVVDRAAIHQDLLEYDTRQADGSYYQLPKGQLIHLVFFGNKGIPFCTIRRYTPEKYEYYERMLNESFDIIIG